MAQYGAVELEQDNQNEADNADHAAVGDDLQAVEGNVGRNGNCTGLVGCSLLQVSALHDIKYETVYQVGQNDADGQRSQKTFHGSVEYSISMREAV